MSRTKVALLGLGFIADIHIESYHRFVPDAEIVGVFTRKADRAEARSDTLMPVKTSASLPLGRMSSISRRMDLSR